MAAITVGTEGPKLEKARVKLSAAITKFAAKHPFDEDVQQLLRYDTYTRALLNWLSGDDDATFDTLFTETTIT